MKPEEVMIRCIVEHINLINGEKTTIEIGPDEIVDMGVNGYHYNPIPLNNELLEKLGFELTKDDAKFFPRTWIFLDPNSLESIKLSNDTPYAVVSPSEYNDETTNNTGIIVRFLHELQILFNLKHIKKDFTVCLN